jgi:hypothetical protein
MWANVPNNTNKNDEKLFSLINFSKGKKWIRNYGRKMMKNNVSKQWNVKWNLIINFCYSHEEWMSLNSRENYGFMNEK